MPTTQLDGESLEAATRRRFEEEAAIEKAAIKRGQVSAACALRARIDSGLFDDAEDDIEFARRVA